MNTWNLLVMGGPLFGGDTRYNGVCVAVVFLVGVGILMKTRSRFGWVFIAASLVWAYDTFKDYVL
ncbi:hypothetical protein FJY63_12405 [Candidatus Sumerlaeota bacterium]|nr:hypothetical protein [Candidatus Sumerlaeota bacterium]